MKNAVLMALALFAVVVVSNGSAVTSKTIVDTDLFSIITSILSYSVKMFVMETGIVI